ANDDAEWARVLDVNVVSVARVTTAALPHLRRSEAAAVVNTASIASVLGLPNRVLYSASKGAVQSMTLAMAADWVADGIRVNAIGPGTANTPWIGRDRKSTRLNSSHVKISYAVFCLKKKMHRVTVNRTTPAH